MSVSCDADLIILGGGCSGLSLARSLSRCRNGLRMIVLESRESYENDRTWCFWAGPNHNHRHLVRHQWDAWEFSTGERKAVQRSQNGTTYQCIPADAFYADAIREIRSSDRVSLRLGTPVVSVSESSQQVSVETCDGLLHSKWVVDTRPPRPSDDRRGALRQIFVGTEVRTSWDVFDPSLVGLMRDMSVDDLGFRFTYVLPFSSRHALIEETRFSTKLVSQERLHSDLQATLSQLVAPDAVETVREEAGCIPMIGATSPKKDGDRVVDAGTRGGAVRASSGYAFLRIQDWAAACAAQLNVGAGPIRHPVEPTWRSLVDRLFLRVLRTQPGLTPELFMAIGKQLSANTVVRFLSDDGRPSDFLRVAGALPKRPFLRELAFSLGERTCL